VAWPDLPYFTWPWRRCPDLLYLTWRQCPDLPYFTWPPQLPLFFLVCVHVQIYPAGNGAGCSRLILHIFIDAVILSGLALTAWKCRATDKPGAVQVGWPRAWVIVHETTAESAWSTEHRCAGCVYFFELASRMPPSPSHVPLLWSVQTQTHVSCPPGTHSEHHHFWACSQGRAHGSRACSTGSSPNQNELVNSLLMLQVSLCMCLPFQLQQRYEHWALTYKSVSSAPLSAKLVSAYALASRHRTMSPVSHWAAELLSASELWADAACQRASVRRQENPAVHRRGGGN